MTAKVDASTMAVAHNIWRAMDANERHGVAFGLFPFNKMNEATKAGYDGRLLSVALMDIAKEKAS